MHLIDHIPTDQIKEDTLQTIGFFDGVHRGHRYLLKQVTEEAKLRKLKSMVVTFRQHPRKVLHPQDNVPLLTTLQEKLGFIGQCGIDYVALLDFTPQLAQMDARQYMSDILRDQLRGKALVIGYDHHFGKRDGKGFSDYRQYGTELGVEVIQALQLPAEYSPHASSTAIRNALSSGDVTLASEILGRPYSVSGTVTHGQAIGRTIGFPTANITPDSTDKLIPQNGVYATVANIGGHNYNGMLYIGNRPTVDNHHERRIEVNLLDFDHEIYNRHISVSFIDRLRGEQHFDSLDQLKAQLQRDREQTRAILGKQQGKNKSGRQ